MTKYTKTQKELIQICRDNINADGDGISSQSLRFHIIHQRNGMGCKARLWHYDGHVITSAGGCGYDREGTVLGSILQMVFSDRLAQLPLPVRNERGNYDRSQLYGLYERTDGTRYLEGGCGWGSMVTIAKAMGLQVERFTTGKLTTMFTISKM